MAKCMCVIPENMDVWREYSCSCTCRFRVQIRNREDKKLLYSCPSCCKNNLELKWERCQSCGATLIEEEELPTLIELQRLINEHKKLPLDEGICLLRRRQ